MPDPSPAAHAPQAKAPDSASPEEPGDLVQVLAALSTGGVLEAPELAWRNLVAEPAGWLGRAGLLGAPLAALWLGAVLGLTARPDLLLLAAYALPLLAPAAGMARHRRLLQGGGRDHGACARAVLRCLPGYLLHALAATGTWLCMANRTLPEWTVWPSWALLALLPFSWAVTASEIVLMDHDPVEGVARGPARALGYLVRLPGRLVSRRGPRPRLLETLLVHGMLVLMAGIVGTALAGGVLTLLDPGVGPLGWAVEYLAAWIYFSGILLALDSGSGLWTMRYLEHQLAVGALGLTAGASPPRRLAS